MSPGQRRSPQQQPRSPRPAEPSPSLSPDGSLGLDKLLPQLRVGKLLRMWGPAHGHAVPGTFCSFPHQNALQELYPGLVDPRQTSAPSPKGPGALLSAPTWLLSPIFMAHTHWEPLLAGPVLRAAPGAPAWPSLRAGDQPSSGPGDCLWDIICLVFLCPILRSLPEGCVAWLLRLKSGGPSAATPAPNLPEELVGACVDCHSRLLPLPGSVSFPPLPQCWPRDSWGEASRTLNLFLGPPRRPAPLTCNPKKTKMKPDVERKIRSRNTREPQRPGCDCGIHLSMGGRGRGE